MGPALRLKATCACLFLTRPVPPTLSMPAPPSRSSSARMCLKNSAARKRRRFASPRLSQRPCTIPLTKLGNVQRRGGEEIWKKLGRNSKRKYLKFRAKTFCDAEEKYFWKENKKYLERKPLDRSPILTQLFIYLTIYLK